MGEPADDALAHYGVKGMKWGVRRDKGHEGERAKTKKIEKLDKKFERDAQSLNTMIKIHNSAADRTNKNDVERINNKPQYKGKDFSRDSPLRRKYYKEHQDAFLDNVVKAAEELGTNASGTKRYGILEGADGGWNVILQDVKHADDSVLFKVKVTYDNMGHILSLKVIEKDLAQSGVTLGDFLAHYGVKGMRWGVRKQADGSMKPSGKTPKSEDHETSRELMKKRPSQMSNSELKKLNERLQLEKTYSELMTKQGSTVGKGQTYVKNSLSLAKTAGEVYNVVNSPAGKALADLVRTALR